MPVRFLLLPLLALLQSDGLPRYLPAHLECAVFQETITGDVRGEAGRAIRQERLGRQGVLMLRGAASDSGLLVEAWFDSLRVWRESPGARHEPDVDGILGGRWIGRLSGDGHWAREQTPFVPDEVAAVMDLRPVLDDFFPLLPRRSLAVGAADTSNGRVIRRERDVVGAWRYRWRLSRRIDPATRDGDSLAARVRQDVEEDGRLVWSPSEGPVRWERTITTTVRPMIKGVAGGSRGLVRQRVEVVRLAHRVCRDG